MSIDIYAIVSEIDYFIQLQLFDMILIDVICAMWILNMINDEKYFLIKNVSNVRSDSKLFFKFSSGWSSFLLVFQD